MAQFQDYSIPSVLDATAKIAQAKQAQPGTDVDGYTIGGFLDRFQKQQDAVQLRADNEQIRQDAAQTRADAEKARQDKAAAEKFNADVITNYIKTKNDESLKVDGMAPAQVAENIIRTFGPKAAPIIKKAEEDESGAMMAVLDAHDKKLGLVLKRLTPILSLPPDQQEAAWQEAVGEGVRDRIIHRREDVPAHVDQAWIQRQVDSMTEAKVQIEAQRKVLEERAKKTEEKTKGAPKASDDLAASAWRYGHAAKTQDDWNYGRNALLEQGFDRGAIDRVMPPVFDKDSVRRLNEIKFSPEEKARADDREADNRRMAQSAATAGGSGDPVLSDAAITRAAKFWNDTGTLPPEAQGMGKGAYANRVRIANRAEELKPGGAQAFQRASYKADSAAYQDAVKQKAKLATFEGTARKNLVNMIGLAKKIVDTGSPFLNKPIREFSSDVLGNPDVAAFETQRTAVVPEFGLILGQPGLSGTLTVSGRAEVDKMLRGELNMRQTLAIANVLLQDLDNRAGSIDETIEGLADRMRGGPDAAAPPPATPGAGRGAGGGPGPGGPASLTPQERAEQPPPNIKAQLDRLPPKSAVVDPRTGKVYNTPSPGKYGRQK